MVPVESATIAAALAEGNDDAYGVDEGGTIDAVPAAVKVIEEKFQVTPGPDAPGEVGLLPIKTVAVKPAETFGIFAYWSEGCAEQYTAMIKEIMVNVFFIKNDLILDSEAIAFRFRLQYPPARTLEFILLCKNLNLSTFTPFAKSKESTFTS
jgi:hypothetical protein